MSYEIQYDISSVPVDTGDEAEEFLRNAQEIRNNWGKRGMTFWLGPADADPDDFPLRIDIDPDADAAAIRWIPENLVGVVPGFESRPIRVLEDSSEPLVDIPANLVHSDLETARNAAARYIETGERPDLVQWMSTERTDSINEISGGRLPTTPELEAQLRARIDDLGSREMAELAPLGCR